MTDRTANADDATDEADPVLASLVAAFNASRAALDAYRIARANEGGGGLVQLKAAAAVWKITEDAALRRAQKGAGVKRFGKWYVPRSAL